MASAAAPGPVPEEGFIRTCPHAVSRFEPPQPRRLCPDKPGREARDGKTLDLLCAQHVQRFQEQRAMREAPFLGWSKPSKFVNPQPWAQGDQTQGCPRVPGAPAWPWPPPHHRSSPARSLLPEGHLELTAACNAHCGCWAGHYTPVCGSDGLMYHSPCHAGCTEAATPGPGGQMVSLATAHIGRTGPWEAPPLPPVIGAVVVCSQVYRDCSCVPQNLSSGFGHATAGKCTSTCQRKPLLLVFIFVVIIFTFLSSIPALTATLR